ncbi:MAG: nitroreductase family protein [Bacteroidota bacterium]
MNSFLDLVKKRYSVRNYLDRVVEEEKLAYVLEAGRLAPSAANFQPWQVLVILNEENRKELATTYPRPWFLQAPIVLVICGDHSAGWKRSDGKDHTDIDVSIMVDHMTLAAAEKDLGTCWICNFDAVKASEILDLPDNIEPIVLLPLGYPNLDKEDNPRHGKRKTMKEIIHYEKYDNGDPTGRPSD